MALASTLACLYAICKAQPLHIEIFSVTARPLNGTLQVIQCSSAAAVVVGLHGGAAAPAPVASCRRVVDTTQRLSVNVFHVSMAVPFLMCCVVGAVFSVITSKQDAAGMGVFSSEEPFATSTYASASSSSSARGGKYETGGGNPGSLYAWELVYWLYVALVHCTLLTTLTSPVDIFDTLITTVVTVLSLMFLCRPRDFNDDGGGGGGESGGGGGGCGNGATNSTGIQSVVMCILLATTWLGFSSIPHNYEEDRIWLFATLLSLDVLALVVHMYDTVPSMYTVVMGRLTYVTCLNIAMAYAFYTLEHRLSVYVHDPWVGGGTTIAAA